MRKPTMIPKNLQQAETFLADDLSQYAGRELRDEAEPALRLFVQSRVATFRIPVKIAGAWAPRKLGRLDEISIRQARVAAKAIREHGFDFARMEDFEHILRRALKDAQECPTVEEAATAALGARVDRGRIAASTVEGYMGALKSAGRIADAMQEERRLNGEAALTRPFLQTPLSEVDVATLRDITKAVRKLSKDNATKMRLALYWAYEHALEVLAPGVEYNLVPDAKVRVRTIEKSPSRDSLEWAEVRLLWAWLADPRCPLTPDEIRFYRVLLLTGERVDSLCHAEWDDIGEDGWWVIRPEKRKTQVKLLNENKAQPLLIFVTPLLREVLGERPDGARWIFPAKSEPDLAMPTSSLPLFSLLRARDLAWLNTGKARLVPPERVAAALKAEKRYAAFPLPDGFRRCCHHEMRHTVATLAQEEGIPGAMLSKMLGHASERELEKEINKSRVDYSRVRPVPIPRIMLRQAEAAQCAATVTRRYYTHLATDMPALRAAWMCWTGAFYREVLGGVPESFQKELDALRGPEDRIIDLLAARFGGDLDKALQVIRAATPTAPAQAVQNQ